MRSRFTECKLAADRFYSVSKRIAKDYFEIANGFMYPYVVNFSFTCELYLKAIRLHDVPSLKRVPGGHKLKSIFKDLTDAEKIEITKMYELKSLTPLNKLLVEDNRDFEVWRYGFEEEEVKANISGLELFADVLHDYVKSLN